LDELFRGFVDELENRLQHGVAPLNVPPAAADLGRLNGVVVQGELDPGRPAAWIYYGVGPAADNYLWIEARYLLIERIKPGGLDLDPLAEYRDSGRYHLSVNKVFVFKGYQYPHHDQPPHCELSW
jgi:hypothetical protein